MIQSKSERKRIIKRNTNRLREVRKEIKRKRIRVRENEDNRKEKNSKNNNLSGICTWMRYKNK